MNKIKVGIFGLGLRGFSLMKHVCNVENVRITALCDLYPERIDRAIDYMKEKNIEIPSFTTDDYHKLIAHSDVDVVMIFAAWEAHIPASIEAMRAGKPVAVEVAGAYSIDQCWELVKTYEETKTPIMMMENCCYGRIELLALNMKRQGVLGKIVHCEGKYGHDLRSMAKSPKHYRIWEYLHRNCENYPTHEIGPIAKLLDINCGNRFTSLVSVGSASHGLEEYVKSQDIKQFENMRFVQSDVVTTVIKCYNGETVTIALDTTLPRYYSRGFTVHGTKGLISEDNSSVFIDGDPHEGDWEWDWRPNYNNIEKYYEKYDHKRWQGYKPGKEGHGGMDALVFTAFFEALDKGEEMPIDVYDFATWACISVLSEQSLLTGQAVAFPDFTDGKWVSKKNTFEL